MNTSVIIAVVLVVAVAVGVWYFFIRNSPKFVYDLNSNAYAIELNKHWYIFITPSNTPIMGYNSLFAPATITNAPKIKLPINTSRDNITWAHIVPTSATSTVPALAIYNNTSGGWQIYPITSQSVYSAYNFMGTYVNHSYSPYTLTFWSGSPAVLSTIPL
jgi:hypothetical protein